MARMGRKTKYTPERLAVLRDAISEGASRKLACKHAGISFETFCQWMEHRAEFPDLVQSAESAFIMKCVKQVQIVGAEDWKMWAWLLEKKDPENYGKKITIDIEARVRELAAKEGLNPDEAVQEALAILKG